MDPFLGEIKMVGFDFAPKGWALCNGQLLSVSQNMALFALLGTAFGGDGVQTFGVPDLRGRVPINYGQGPGLANFVMGEKGGVAEVNAPLLAHTHTAVFTGTPGGGSASITVNVQGSSAGGGTTSPNGNYLAGAAKGLPTADLYVANPAANTLGNLAGVSGSLSGLPAPTGTVTVTATGTQGAVIPTEPPFQVVNFIIATQGVYPTRS